MNTFADSRLRSIAAVVAVSTTLALALAGCVSGPGTTAASTKTSTPTTTTTSTPSAPPVAGTTPSASPAVPAAATTTSIPCDTLLSGRAVYDFNPNFGLDGSFTPKAGSAAATAVADKGTACNWTNQSSGDTFTVAVARPAAADLASLKAAAAKGSPAAGLGDAAYFSRTGGVGRVDAFTGAYWLVTTSVYFASAEDANGLVAAALGALK